MDEHEQRTAPSELSVVGVRVELPSQQPIVLLKEVAGDRYLPIWIGAVEATAIAFAQQGVVTARPMTHDLLRDLLGAFDRPLRSVTITGLREGVFHAELGFDGGPAGQRPAVRRHRARPAHRRRRSAAEEAVLAEAGIAIPDEQEDEVEKFREFLDQINPEDFES